MDCMWRLGGSLDEKSRQINSGDDDGCPTARHNEARMAICEELWEGTSSVFC